MLKYAVLGWTGSCIVGLLVLAFRDDEADCELFCSSDLGPGGTFAILLVPAAFVWIGGFILLVLISSLVDLWRKLRAGSEGRR